MRVGIVLEPGQSEAEAEELILKALNSHRNGEAHSHDRFIDPAMEHMATKLEKSYEKMTNSMLDEIFKVLDDAT